jgi:hypothetical protein
MRAAGEPSQDASPSDSARQQAIREHLETVLASPILASSPRRAQLLRYLCTRALDGEGEQVNEYAIGIDVFEKSSSFDPRIDSIVRTLGWIAILENDCAAARSAAQTAAEWYLEQGDKTGSPVMKVRCGQPDEARRQLEAMGKESEKEFVSPYSIAQGYALLHDADRAIEYLEKSAGAKESSILYIASTLCSTPSAKIPDSSPWKQKSACPLPEPTSCPQKCSSESSHARPWSHRPTE